MNGDEDQSMANEFGDLGDLCDEIANEGSLNSSPSSPSQTVPVTHAQDGDAVTHSTTLWSWLDFQQQLIESGAEPSLATKAWVANHFRFVHAALPAMKLCPAAVGREPLCFGFAHESTGGLFGN